MDLKSTNEPFDELIEPEPEPNESQPHGQSTDDHKKTNQMIKDRTATNETMEQADMMDRQISEQRLKEI